MAVVVELLNKQHKVIERHKFRQAEVRFGRAYDNDVILYDKHVCPHHACLIQDEAGQWLLQDLSSMNGSYLAPKQPIQQTEPLRSGQICWLGEQALRIYDDQHQVPPAQPFNAIEQKLSSFGHWGLICGLLLFFVASELFSLWLNSTDDASSKWSRRLIELPVTLLVFCLWPALLALWSKLNQHEARFLPQLAITFLGITALACWQFIQTLLNFSADGAAWVEWIDKAGRILIFVMLLAGNFWLALQWTAPRKLMLAAGIGLVLNLQSLVGGQLFMHDNQRMYPSYDGSLLPMSFYLNRATPAAEFTEQNALLFLSVDEKKQNDD